MPHPDSDPTYIDSLDDPPDPNARQWHDYFRWFVRRFWIFLITVIGGYLLGLYIHSATPAKYRSEATIEILRVKQQAAEVAEEEKIQMTGVAQMRSAVEKLKVRSLYEEIAEGPVFADRKNVAPEQFVLPWQDGSPALVGEQDFAALGGMLREWIAVKWRPDTTLLDLEAVHSDPEIARDALAGLLAAYEQATEDKVAGSSEYALDYILESSSEIKERLLGLERAQRLYNRCMNLSEEIRAAERQIAEMEKRYLPKWPALVEAKELREILQRRFSKELEQVIRLSEDERAFWEENRAALDGLSEDELVDARIRLVSTRASVLERELEAEQQIYDNLITKLKEGNLTKDFAGKQFDIVQAPTLPDSPVGPDRKRILALSTGGGAALGIGIILLLGFLDPTTRTVAELEEFAGLSVIGALPAAKEDKRVRSLVLHEEPDSPPAEAIRTLRAGLTFLGTSEERRSFLVTSAVPYEGKSWVASNLALGFALQGDRTLLIEADLRRPVQSEIFDFEKGCAGLSDQLSLDTPLKEVIRRTNYSENLFLLPAGSRSANPSELLAGRSLPALIDKLGEYFDRIVVDSAPLVPVSDSLSVSRLVQSVVMVVRMGKTPRGAIKRSLRTLRENGVEPVGLVANGLPRTRTKGAYGYYYSYYGGGNYGGYGGYRHDDGDADSDEPTGASAPPAAGNRSREKGGTSPSPRST